MVAILRVRELYKFFDQREGATPVLKGITFDVEPGEFVCIMGPSGSGKSTLLHILSGLDAANGGAVELAGRNLKELADSERTLLRREQVGYVFQFFNLLPNLNVLENVGLPLAIQGAHPSAKEALLRALLARLGLAGKEGQFPHQLSGGEMQRTSIARALAGGQPLLLCDEPTGNLSQKAGLEVMRILRQVCDENRRTVVLVTHNPRDATFADRVLFLVDGALDVQHALTGPNLTVEAVHERLASLHI
ncbi:MAG: ABC transporter ATP-binding protein [Planctomycetes bacterium]|nr:ABC transporter ATP-binding protein [Planctomycetota bacterium]